MLMENRFCIKLIRPDGERIPVQTCQNISFMYLGVGIYLINYICIRIKAQIFTWHDIWCAVKHGDKELFGHSKIVH